MIPGAVLAGYSPARAEHGAGVHPAAIALHGCDGPDADAAAIADLLRARGFQVLRRDLCAVPEDRRGAEIHATLDRLAAQPQVDRARIVVIGRAQGGSALLAALNHRIGPQPLQARAAVAIDPACGPYARTQGAYLPVAPLLILIGQSSETVCAELSKWTPKVTVQSFHETRDDAYAAMLEFLERELR
jgi:dienelactone hydrolase